MQFWFSYRLCTLFHNLPLCPVQLLLYVLLLIFSVIAGIRSSLDLSTSSDGYIPYKITPGRTISRCISGYIIIPALLQICLIGILSPFSSSLLQTSIKRPYCKKCIRFIVLVRCCKNVRIYLQFQYKAVLIFFIISSTISSLFSPARKTYTAHSCINFDMNFRNLFSFLSAS